MVSGAEGREEEKEGEVRREGERKIRREEGRRGEARRVEGSSFLFLFPSFLSLPYPPLSPSFPSFFLPPIHSSFIPEK